MVIKIKKMYGTILIMAMLTMTMLCVNVVSAASAATEDAIGPGDCIPNEGSPDIRPGDLNGVGPAPESGDGEPDCSGC